MLLELALRAGKSDGGAGLVLGEAGIGKSRLVGEFARQAQERGVRVLLGECVDLADTERRSPGRSTSATRRSSITSPGSSASSASRPGRPPDRWPIELGSARMATHDRSRGAGRPR